MEKALAIQREVQRILGTDEVYLVGGSVRDLVMDNTPKDYDFTTALLPEVMVERVKAAGRRVYTIGERFGTIGFKVLVVDMGKIDWENVTPTDTVEVKETYEYVEVTTFRSEVYTNKSRKPEVKFVPSLDEDLARRDFTMNAMVLRSDGSIYDPYGGRMDIYKGLIKTVGAPKERIVEDPLRMLRAARFSARYNFMIDPNFIGKARQLSDRIYDVSVERWVQELDKMFVAQHFDAGINALEKMGLWDRIFPDIMISWLPNVESFPEDVNGVWRELFKYADHNPKTAKFMAVGMCHRFKFSNARCDIILK